MRYFEMGQAMLTGACMLLTGVFAWSGVQRGSAASSAVFKRIAIADKDGNERIVMGTDASSGIERPEFVLKDSRGRTRLTIGMSETETPFVYLSDVDARPRVRLTLDQDDVAVLAMGVPLDGSLVLLQAGGKSDNPRGSVWAKDSKGHFLLNSEDALK
jgi:hypothetical protein